MNSKAANLTRRYQAVLSKYMQQGSKSRLAKVRGLGNEALLAGLHTLDLARVHEEALVALGLINPNNGTLKRSQVFFAEAITPIEETHRAALKAKVHLDQLNQTLSRRSLALATANAQLKQEISQRRVAERSLRESKRHHGELLERAQELQEQLRRLSHQILLAQEEERKKISRELHDVIAQTLTGINVQLARLKTESVLNTETLGQNISTTQLLVEKSVSIVHQFARQLRPAVLDDLGLIPALHTFLKSFREETGIQVNLTAAAAVEQLDDATRTALYRVAQEALINVARHAQATLTEVRIQALPRHFCLTIQDNGRGFPADRVLQAKRKARLGLLGMRERLEMVGGKLIIKSAAGQGTTIHAQVPRAKRTRGGGPSSLR